MKPLAQRDPHNAEHCLIATSNNGLCNVVLIPIPVRWTSCQAYTSDSKGLHVQESHKNLQVQLVCMEFMTGPTKQASLVEKLRLQPVQGTERWCPLLCVHTQVSKIPIPQGWSISIFGRPEHVTLVEGSRLQAVFPYFIVVSRPNNDRSGKVLHWRHSCSITANAKKWAWKLTW
jgi:hypothetical protein